MASPRPAWPPSEPPVDKENVGSAAQGLASPDTSAAGASPDTATASDNSRKRGEHGAALPGCSVSPIGARPRGTDPPAKRHRPSGTPPPPAPVASSPPDDDEPGCEEARQLLAALQSPSGRLQGAQHAADDAPASAAAPRKPASPPSAPPPPDWCQQGLAPRQRLLDPDQRPFSLLPGHPLLALACEGQAALLAKVLENGGEVDAQDARGLTALHFACRHARLACLKVLLEAGAAQLRDRSGRTPLELAAAAGHADVVAAIQHHQEVQRELEQQQRQQQQQAGAV